MIGSGPEAFELEGIARLTATGALSPEDVKAEMGIAIALIVPSVCYETFGLVIIEAFSTRTPAIVSRLGAFVELVDDGVTGLLFNPGDAEDLARKMQWAVDFPERMAEMGRNARAKYESEFSAETNYEQLIAIYEDAISAVAGESR